MKKLEKEKKTIEKEFEEAKKEAVEHEKRMKDALGRMNRLHAQNELLEKLLEKK